MTDCNAAQGAFDRRITLALAVAISLVAGVLIFYYSSLTPRGLYVDANSNTWFGSDTGRVFNNMTDRTTGHASTSKHPIFSILGWSAMRVVMLAGVSPIVAARVLLSLNGAAFVGLLFVLVRRLGAPTVTALACAALAICSATFRFWFVLPETFPFGATSLLMALMPLARLRAGGSPSVLAWIFAAAASLSITVTSYGLGMIVTVFAALKAPFSGRLMEAVRALRWRFAIVVGLGSGLLVLAIAAVQRLTFGGAGMFINVVALSNDRQFIVKPTSLEVLGRIYTILVSPMVVGMPRLPPSVTIGPTGYLQHGLSLDGALPAGPLGGVGLAIWAALLAFGTFLALRNWRQLSVDLACLLFLIFQLALYLIYGNDVFLYVALLFPLEMVLVASAAMRLGSKIFVPLAIVLCVAGAVTSIQSAATAQRSAVSVMADLARLH